MLQRRTNPCKRPLYLPADGDRLAAQVEVAQEFAITGSSRRGMIGGKDAAALLRIVVLETRAPAGRPYSLVGDYR